MNSSKNYKPDFGKYFVKLSGRETKFVSPGFRLFAIYKMVDSQYSITSNISIGGVEYCITLDFDEERLDELLEFEGCDELKTYIRDLLSQSYEEIGIVDLKSTPIEVTVAAIPGEEVVLEKESFIPFIVESFASPSLVTTDTEYLFPLGFTHVIMFNDEPIGFAIEVNEDGEVITTSGNEDSREEQFEYDDFGNRVPKNTVYCIACLAGMGMNCEMGDSYLYDSLEKASESMAWKLMGPFSYAVPVEKLTDEQILFSSKMWIQFEEDFRVGFGKFGIKL
jgi:YD repeat-containing protein